MQVYYLSNMGQCYNHFISDNRMVIRTLLQEGKNYSYIAAVIDVHKSAICIEIARNCSL